ncbi:MAG: ribonuclease D [Verrucomicrobia bacterium]|nr:ribonuclease D [Verrucomicrobiota bacterium]
MMPPRTDPPRAKQSPPESGRAPLKEAQTKEGALWEWLKGVSRTLLRRKTKTTAKPPAADSAAPETASHLKPSHGAKPAHSKLAKPRPAKPAVQAHSQVVPAEIPFRMISTDSDLAEAVKTFAPHPRIALDTEADSLHCYFDKLCLIQISIPGHNFLIDPLAGISLNPLFEALEGKTVIIHSADYDLRLLRRCNFTGPTLLFDTMIAARLCGATEFGLAALLHQHFGVTLAKASQKANWARRPLPAEMLHYAVNDTLNLLTLSQIQEARLRELGRYEWFEQMCEKAIRSASVIRERDPDTLWRISGYADLSRRGSAVLRALWYWRDSEAQAVDKPAFHIASNDHLLEFAGQFDKGHTPDTRHIKGSRRTRLLQSAEEALLLPEDDWPKILRKPRLRTTQEQEARFKDLRRIRDSAGAGLNLDPTLIASKATLEQLSRNEAPALESIMPWQRQLLRLD